MRDSKIDLPESKFAFPITFPGMHGAGLSHTTVMPQHGALIELMPKYVKPIEKPHFKVIAKGRKLIYKMWWNRDPKLEFKDNFTKVPPKVILDFVNESRAEMCTKQKVQQRKTKEQGAP